MLQSFSVMLSRPRLLQVGAAGIRPNLERVIGTVLAQLYRVNLRIGDGNRAVRRNPIEESQCSMYSLGHIALILD